MQAQEPLNAVLGRPVRTALRDPGSYTYLFSYEPLDTKQRAGVCSDLQTTDLQRSYPMKRHKMSAAHSKRDFRKKASRVHRRNGLSPMRGGIRA